MHHLSGRLRGSLTGLLVMLFLLPAAVQADEEGFSAAQEEEIGRLVRAYLLKHPEVILEAIEELQRRDEMASAAARDQAIAQSASDLYEDPASPIAGNPEGDVTIVEFFDYNCPYCKRVTPEIFGLLAQDGNIRYIAKEFPIFGEDSGFAARAAMAADRQGKYAAFHQALMAIKGPANPTTVKRAAADAGLDWEQLEADMEDEAITRALERNAALARRLGVEGTPAMVIGETFIPGAAPASKIAAVIAEERAKATTN